METESVSEPYLNPCPFPSLIRLKAVLQIHSHKEAIIGHLKDKEYLDSRLGQARDAHTAILKKHDLLVKELSQAKVTLIGDPPRTHG